jgi:Ca2+-dependent lipid-binding protein
MSHVIELSTINNNNITELDDNYRNNNMLSNESNESNIILKKLDRDIKINTLLLFILNIFTFICGCGLLSLIIIIIILMFI